MDLVRRLLRPAAAIVLALGWTLFCVMVSAFLSISGQSLGWLWVALLLAVGLVPIALVCGATHRLIAIPVAIALAFGIGAVTWYSSPPSRDRIAATVETVAIPQGWGQVSENEYGDSWCWMGCPELVRVYKVPDDSAQAHADLRSNLEADGWEADESRDGRFTRGRWKVFIYERTHTNEPTLSVTVSG